MCQPLYDMEQLTAFLDRVGKIPVPFLLGVMPLQSYRHAEFLHNELPGVSIPDHLASGCGWPAIRACRRASASPRSSWPPPRGTATAPT